MAVYNTGLSDNVDLIFFEEVINHKLIESCIKYGLKEFAYKKGKEFYECSIKKIKAMIKKCINFHDYKIARPPSADILQIKFLYIKENFDQDKYLQLIIDDYDPDDEESNVYEDHWSADDIDIFKKKLFKIESDGNHIMIIEHNDDDDQTGGRSKINTTYNENKQAYNLLTFLNKNKID